MFVPQAVINIRQRRAGLDLKSFRLEAGLLTQPREQPDPNGNRYRHKAILVSDKDMDFLSRVERPLHRRPRAF